MRRKARVAVDWGEGIRWCAVLLDRLLQIERIEFIVVRLAEFVGLLGCDRERSSALSFVHNDALSPEQHVRFRLGRSDFLRRLWCRC